jgi:hypothetical protein
MTRAANPPLWNDLGAFLVWRTGVNNLTFSSGA